MSLSSDSDSNNNGNITNTKNDVKILPNNVTPGQRSARKESLTSTGLKRNSIVLPLSGIVLTDVFPKHVKSFEEILEDLGIYF